MLIPPGSVSSLAEHEVRTLVHRTGIEVKEREEDSFWMSIKVVVDSRVGEEEEEELWPLKLRGGKPIPPDWV